jgi:hypothetical protein
MEGRGNDPNKTTAKNWASTCIFSLMTGQCAESKVTSSLWWLDKIFEIFYINKVVSRFAKERKAH